MPYTLPFPSPLYPFSSCLCLRHSVAIARLLNGRCTSLLRALVSEMTYTVSSGTLNATIPYHTMLNEVSKGSTAEIGQKYRDVSRQQTARGDVEGRCLCCATISSRRRCPAVLLFKQYITVCKPPSVDERFTCVYTAEPGRTHLDCLLL